MADEPRFRVIEAVERAEKEARADAFLRHSETQIAIGAGLKCDAGLALAEIRRREAERAMPNLFPEMVEGERRGDEALKEKLNEQYERGERFLQAGKSRRGFGIVK